MIEKLKDYLYITNTKDPFSIIEVLPKLNYDGNKLEEDKKNAIEESHSEKYCNFKIIVRSLEAREELTSYLLGKGFETSYLSDCKIKIANHTELGEVYKFRKYYKVDEQNNIASILLDKSGLAVNVFVKIEELSEFRKAIIDLQEREYRNVWKLDEGKVIIA